MTSAKLVEAIIEARSSGRESTQISSAIGIQSRLTSAATVEYVPSLDALRRAVRAAMLPGDVVLFLGAGDITKAAHELAAELREEAVSSNEQTLAALTACLSPESIVRRDEPLAKRTTSARRRQGGLLRRAGVGRGFVARAEVLRGTAAEVHAARARVEPAHQGRRHPRRGDLPEPSELQPAGNHRRQTALRTRV